MKTNLKALLWISICCNLFQLIIINWENYQPQNVLHIRPILNQDSIYDNELILVLNYNGDSLNEEMIQKVKKYVSVYLKPRFSSIQKKDIFEVIVLKENDRTRQFDLKYASNDALNLNIDTKRFLYLNFVNGIVKDEIHYSSSNRPKYSSQKNDSLLFKH